jgi:hypothetical protein
MNMIRSILMDTAELALLLVFATSVGVWAIALAPPF